MDTHGYSSTLCTTVHVPWDGYPRYLGAVHDVYTCTPSYCESNNQRSSRGTTMQDCGSGKICTFLLFSFSIELEVADQRSIDAYSSRVHVYPHTRSANNTHNASFCECVWFFSSSFVRCLCQGFKCVAPRSPVSTIHCTIS